MKEVNGSNTSPVVTLEAETKELDFSKLRAKDNKLANSGETMYLDLGRMNFIINEKKIDNNFIKALKEGAKHPESELFNSSDIFNSKGTREIDTDHGQVFVASVLKELGKDAFLKVWEDHCKKDDTTADQKTNSYKEEFEKFYNAGQKYAHRAPEAGEENKNFRPLVKEFVKEIFEYAGVKASNEIVNEFITTCNQAGCVGALYRENGPLIHVANIHNLSFSSSHTTYINCSDSNHVTFISDEVISVRDFENPKEILCKLDSSLEFTLESQDGKDGVTYKDGKLTLTIPRELENYHSSDKEEQSHSDTTVKTSLLEHIIEKFLVIIEELFNIKPENRQRFHEGIKNALSRSKSSEAIVIKDTGYTPLKIEHNLGDPLTVVNGHLDVKSYIDSNKHIEHDLDPSLKVNNLLEKLGLSACTNSRAGRTCGY